MKVLVVVLFFQTLSAVSYNDLKIVDVILASGQKSLSKKSNLGHGIGHDDSDLLGEIGRLSDEFADLEAGILGFIDSLKDIVEESSEENGEEDSSEADGVVDG